MIPDRIIEQGTLTTHGRAAPRSRSVCPGTAPCPGSCIAGAKLTVDGVEAPAESLRWSMNGREFSFDELRRRDRANGGSRPTRPCSRATFRSIRMPSTR